MDMDIVVTATNAKEPVLRGEWLAAGTHVNPVGSNFLSKQEIDVEAVRRAACVIVDSAEQAKLESGDLAHAADSGAFFWEDARELGEVIAGEFPGREDPKEITLFESQGIALEDIALAAEIYRAARISKRRPVNPRLTVRGNRATSIDTFAGRNRTRSNWESRHRSLSGPVKSDLLS